ncbi:hypothetical protein [Xanthomarina gelatinilytica]|uniref:hypothetical protein n=1 Tax=Xanthomarina gelatinilytica TaxID=1137281 RepID=UPI003AA88C52
MALMIIFLVAVGSVLIYGFIKMVNAILNPAIKRLDQKKKRILQTDNPYIVAHRMKFSNDKMYDEYLDWLDKNGGDLPFEKWKSEEELRADANINKSLKI